MRACAPQDGSNLLRGGSAVGWKRSLHLRGWALGTWPTRKQAMSGTSLQATRMAPPMTTASHSRARPVSVGVPHGGTHRAGEGASRMKSGDPCFGWVIPMLSGWIALDVCSDGLDCFQCLFRCSGLLSMHPSSNDSKLLDDLDMRHAGTVVDNPMQHASGLNHSYHTAWP